MVTQAASVAIEFYKPIELDVLQMLWDLHKSPARKAGLVDTAAAYDDTLSWVDPNGHKLSDRVWKAGEGVQTAVTDRVRLGLLNGDGVLDIAGDLEKYLLPDLRPVRGPGGTIPDGRGGVLTKAPYGGRGSYPARRLARTEMSRALGNLTEQMAKDLGIFLRWSLSNGHPRFDVCDGFASGGIGFDPLTQQNFPPGVYLASQFPSYPAHPHCKCSLLTYDIRTDEEILAQLRKKYGLPDLAN